PGREASPAPTGPCVQENLGPPAPSRTYQYLLQNPHDEALFDYYLCSQLAYVNLNGEISVVGKPGIFKSLSFSPDGQYLLIGQIQRPYSYLVQVGSFPFHMSVWSRNGDLVKELHQYALDEAATLARDAVSPDPRSYGWRPDQPATLTWIQALDQGNPSQKAAHRDALYELPAPFSAAPRE